MKKNATKINKITKKKRKNKKKGEKNKFEFI